MNAPIHFHDEPSSRRCVRYRIRPPVVWTVREQPSKVSAAPETATDWHLVHERMLALRTERAKHEHELGQWLRAAERLAVHTRLGFASLGEYAERVLGVRTRGLEERLRVARELESLPLLDAALHEGTLCWSAVRELSRVATRDTEGAWQRWAEGRRLREVEQAVASHRPGQRPEDRPDPSLVRHVLRFEVRPETMAMFRDLEARVRAELGGAPSSGEVDDDTLLLVLLEIARRALGGPTDEGRASYQVAVTRCPSCLRTSIDAAGQSHEVDAAVAEMVECDCQDVGVVDGPASRSRPNGVDGGSPHVGGLDGGNPHVGGLDGGSPHVGGLDGGSPLGVDAGRAELPRAIRSRTRARQSIPPAVRRAVMRRDHGHCQVPGCRNHHFIDIHHCRPRSEGGDHDPELLLCLCGSHHRTAHAGNLVIGGSASQGFTFRSADGSAYGGPARPEAIDVTQQVLGTLRHLGFPAGQARALVDQVLRQGVPQGLDAFVRAALEHA
jgi:hypothetical protein